MDPQKKKRKRHLRHIGSHPLSNDENKPLVKRVVRGGMDGELSREDFDILGPVNVANDGGDDEQLKYWEELADGWAGSQMEETDMNIGPSTKEEKS
jgi:hypothetical protein